MCLLHRQMARKAKCANRFCEYLVHPDRCMGGFCCKRCHASNAVPPDHGQKCLRQTAERCIVRSAPTTPQEPMSNKRRKYFIAHVSSASDALAPVTSRPCDGPWLHDLYPGDDSFEGGCIWLATTTAQPPQQPHQSTEQPIKDLGTLWANPPTDSEVVRKWRRCCFPARLS